MTFSVVNVVAALLVLVVTAYVVMILLFPRILRYFSEVSMMSNPRAYLASVWLDDDGWHWYYTNESGKTFSGVEATRKRAEGKRNTCFLRRNPHLRPQLRLVKR